MRLVLFMEVVQRCLEHLTPEVCVSMKIIAKCVLYAFKHFDDGCSLEAVRISLSGIISFA